MKKIIALFLLLSFILISICGCSNSRNTATKNLPNPESDFMFTIDTTDIVIITKYIGKSNVVIIPDSIQNKPVTQVGIHAFSHTNVTSVEIPDTVTSIKGGAFFECVQLEYVSLPDSLTEIGQRAFESCTSLKHITIPSSVISLGEGAFFESGLESVDIGDGIEVIPGYTFAMTNLVEVVLPKSVRQLGFQSFAGCKHLETITLNEGLITIGLKSFVNNPNLKEITIPKTVEYVTDLDFSLCNNLEKVMFEGNAPATFEYWDSISGVEKPFDVHFTVYYHKGAQGFTSPEWFGYPTLIW